jgi:DNA-directed RNA polymerase alpha subunit
MLVPPSSTIPTSTSQAEKILWRKDEAEYAEIDVGAWSCSKKNRFRTLLMTCIPTPGIDLVEIYENTTILPEESLGLRLGLLPVRMDKTQFAKLKMWNDCLCQEEGCKECCVKGSLKVQNKTARVQIVTSDAIVWPEGCSLSKPDPILLFHLHPGQIVHLDICI